MSHIQVKHIGMAMVLSKDTKTRAAAFEVRGRRPSEATVAGM